MLLSNGPSMLRLRPFTEAGIIHAIINMDEANPPDTNILSPEEKLRYGMYSAPRQKDFLAARAVSKYLIQQSGSTLRPEEINTITPDGKPFVPPESAGGKLFLSISHDSRYCIGVISPSMCGADVETVSGRLSRVSRKLLTGSETKLFSADGNLELLTKIWTIKEAAAKRFGISMLTAMNAVAVIEVSDIVSRYTFKEAGYRAVHAELDGHIFTATV